MVVSASWSIWRQSNSAKAVAIKALILESWWDHVEYLMKFTEPILSMIRYTNMDKPCLGELYDGIDSMIEDIRYIINEREEVTDKKFFKELQVVSSSSSKRKWSTYSIDSIKHNRLNSKKANNSVFGSNFRQTTHNENTYKKGEAKHWDVEPESAKLEAQFDALAIDDGD